jgi:hypothetical protein
MDNLPTETLIFIFTIVSELELQVSPNSMNLADEAIHGSKPRHLKDSMTPVVQVCRHWMDIVYQIPSFWVTRLHLHVTANVSGVELEILRLRECLISSAGSDIDLSLALRPKSLAGPGWSFTHAMECLEADILPVRDRIRCLWLYQYSYGNDPFLLSSFYDRLQDNDMQWRRLHILVQRPDRKFGDRLPPIRLRTPVLSHLEMVGVDWNSDQSSPNSLQYLALACRRRLLTLDSLSKKIEQSLHSLTTLSLSLGIWAGELTWDNKRLDLPNLEKLIIQTDIMSHALACLDMIKTTRLEVLHIDSSIVQEGDPTAFKSYEKHNFNYLHTVGTLRLSLDHICFPYLCSLLPLGSVTDLEIMANLRRIPSVDFEVFRFPGDQAYRSIKFSALRNLFFGMRNLIFDASHEGDVVDFSWFFNLFDFSMTAVSAHISLLPSSSYQFDFPLIQKLRVESISTLKQISAPSVQELYIPLVEQSPISSDIRTSPNLYTRIPFQQVSVLHLSFNSFSSTDSGYNLLPGILQLTPNVSELAFSGVPAYISSDHLFPVFAEDTGSKQAFMVPHTTLRLVLLPTRKIDITSVRNLLRSVLRLLREHQDYGYPLRKLCLDFHRLPLSAYKTELDLLQHVVEEMEVQEYYRQEFEKFRNLCYLDIMTGMILY